ncbi:MAG: preprotein translocase subunit SecG [Ruminococcaceae bacterium]|nr:preprotein translocase subunit SecG [Oscillospiraceae bacterium]
MNPIELVMGIALVALAVFLVVAVLMQQGKDKKLSGSIAGGADTYYGKGKGNRRDKLLFRLTLVGAVLFGVLVVAMYVVVFKLNG